MKHDREAIACFGEAYHAIPKSVFAVAAYHLANVASGEADAPGAATARLIEELEALGQAGCITDAQMRRAVTALRARQ